MIRLLAGVRMRARFSLQYLRRWIATPRAERIGLQRPRLHKLPICWARGHVYHGSYCADDLGDALKSLTSRQGAGAVAWRVANHPEGPFALRKTKPSGWTVIEPLYTHPAKSEAGAVVTNEMVERFCASFFLDGSGSDSTLRDLVRDALVAALEGKAND